MFRKSLQTHSKQSVKKQTNLTKIFKKKKQSFVWHLWIFNDVLVGAYMFDVWRPNRKNSLNLTDDRLLEYCPIACIIDTHLYEMFNSLPFLWLFFIWHWKHTNRLYLHKMCYAGVFVVFLLFFLNLFSANTFLLIKFKPVYHNHNPKMWTYRILVTL